MLLLRPLTLTPDMLTASNAGAADGTYNPATSYSLGQRVYLADNGRTYECIQAPALGQHPATSPLYWARAQPSNRWAMWDAEISTTTATAGSLSATLSLTQRVNAVSLHGLVGASATVVQKDAGGNVLLSATHSLIKDPHDWYGYYFDELEQVNSVQVLNLRPYLVSTLEITVTPTGGVAACAAVVVGNTLHIGNAQYGFNTSIIDYSRKETSAAGVQTLEPGRYADRMSGGVELLRSQYSAVSAALRSVRGRASVLVGVPDSGDYAPMTLLGFFRDWNIEVSNPSTHICSLEYEALSI